MNIAFYIIYFVLLVGVCGCLTFFKLKGKFDIFEKVAKILAIALVVMTFINIFLPDLFAKRGLGSAVDGLITNPNAEFATYRNVWHAILRAGFAIGPVSIPFAIFYKKPYITKVVTYIVLPFSILNAVFFYQYIGYFTSSAAPSVFGEASRAFLQNGAFRSIWFGLLTLTQTSLCVHITIKNHKDLVFNNIKEVGIFLAVAMAFIFTNMPIYTAQHVLGTYSSIILTIGKPGHFIFIAGVIAEGLALYFIFRNQSHENKYILLFVMALSLLFQYNTFFKTDDVIFASRWPVQLCNIAGAFIIVTLLTKSEKMFHFTLVVNTLGALIAIAICDSTTNTGIFYCMNIHYMVEHVNVLLVPVLAGALKVFKPLKAKDVLHALIGFAIYWAFVMVIGTICCAIHKATNDSFWSGVNFLFMFDQGKTVKLVGFVKPLFEAKFEIGNATFYLVQPIVLIAFLALCTGIFFALYPLLKERKAKTNTVSE